MPNGVIVLLVVAAVVAVGAIVWLAMGTRARMRVGGTPPGPPADVDFGTHDEPDTDYGRLVDRRRHEPRTPGQTGADARDEDRLLGH